MTFGKFEYFINPYGTWYFHLKSPNGKIVCAAEGYRSKKSCLKGIAAVRKLAASAKLIEP